MAVLLALCSALLEKSMRGGLVVVGSLNLGGGRAGLQRRIDCRAGRGEGGDALLMPVSARRQLYDLSDDMATKMNIQFYSDARDALLKAMGDT